MSSKSNWDAETCICTGWPWPKTFKCGWMKTILQSWVWLNFLWSDIKNFTATFSQILKSCCCSQLWQNRLFGLGSSYVFTYSPVGLDGFKNLNHHLKMSVCIHYVTFYIKNRSQLKQTSVRGWIFFSRLQICCVDFTIFWWYNFFKSQKDRHNCVAIS